MFEFTIEWTSSHPSAARTSNAKAAIDQTDVRETLILPLVLLIAFLVALGALTGAHLHKDANGALLYAAVGGMGMPMLYPSSDSCRRPVTLGSASRLRHADVLALLAIK
jgi:hypothetical protein